MKAKNFSILTMNPETELNKIEMNTIRGGTSGGGTTPIYEDILIPDPPQTP